ncbi:MAG: phage tail tape measure protein [Paenibacillus sp.]|uniref:phage tail tape measure protein n=1 Tax=Paenibacillus sp. TaxID=58172 RepID=UPI00290B229D|nr:phage tail tape measure protein [Paenibacillus sp.]MDU4696390.1 phage tail tape measure protein [Paenibacillus sp.]
MAKTINTILNLRDKFSGKMKQAANKTKQNSKQMKMLNNHVNSFKRSAVSGFAQVTRKAVGLGAAFVGVTAAVETLRGGSQFLNDYGSSLTNLQAATGATTQEMSAMKSKITDLYKQNMGESWSDLADAMTTAKQITGQMGAELKQTTGFAVTYRDVFGEDLTASIKTADTMMKNFGINSSEAYNLLSQGAQNGLNKSGELLDTANEYSVYFKNLGFSANEMFDIFATGLEKGAFNLDKVGDAMKEFGIRSKDGSKSSAEGFRALGLNAEAMTAAFAKGGPSAQKAFDQVMTALNNLDDPFKKNLASVNLFGTQAEDMEKDVIAALGSARSQFDMTRNTMEQINKIKYNSPAQAMKGIGRLVETSVLVPIADRLLPKLSEFGQWFKDHTPQIEAGIDKAFKKGTKVLQSFGKIVGWVKDNADWLVPVMGGLTAAIVAQKVIGTVSKMYKAWSAVTKGMTVAQIALNFALNANPIGIVVIAIGALVAAGIALYKNWDTVKLKLQQFGAWLDSFPFGKALMDTIRNVIASVKQIFSGLVLFFKSVFKGDWEGAWQGIVQAFKGQFSLISTYAKAPINAVIDMVNGLIEKVNSISVDIPDWMGGGTFGFNIPFRIPKFALGTSYFRGGLAQINERGGEIVNLPGGSQVIPADKSERMINGSRGNVTIQIIVQGNLIGEEEEVNRIMNKAVPKLVAALGNA